MRLRLVLTLGALLAIGAGLGWLAWMCPVPIPSPPGEVGGQVVDDRGPLAGVLVRWQTREVCTQTDEQGRFQLPPVPAGRVTAWKAGYFIGGASWEGEPLHLRLKRLPETDHADYAWVDPAPDPASPNNCANCHGAIYREWAGSGHGRSASGRHFRNLYQGDDWHGRPAAGWGVLTQHEAGAGVCVACHAPALPAGDPAQFDLTVLTGTAARGVHCDYCHKIADVGPGPLGLSHGRFNLTLLRPGPDEQLFFGSLDDVDRGDDAFSPLYRESRYCASCHEGVVFGVPVYSTYSEWLASPARRQGQQCQTCHMAPSGEMTNLAPGHGGRTRNPATLANHRFFAGSQADMLRRCVQLESSPQRRTDGVHLRLRLGLEGAGHRVPTGYIDRQLLLVAQAENARGEPLPLVAGPTLPAPAGRELHGQPGRLFARLLRGLDGKSPAPFWRADPGSLQDTRLAPGQAEEVPLVFPPETARVRIRVLYRRFWDEVIRSKSWPDRDLLVHERLVETP